MHDRISFGGGLVKDTLVLGVSPDYQQIRNLIVTDGRFFDQTDNTAHLHCAVVTQKFADERYGNDDAAVGQNFEIQNIPFTIIGVFREAVNDFGESEIAAETVLIPYSVARYFRGTEAVNQIYFSMRNMGEVPEASKEIVRIVHASAPAQLGVCGADSHRLDHHGGRDRQRPHRGAGPGGRGHPGRGRRGDHEHHVRQCPLPHP